MLQKNEIDNVAIANLLRNVAAAYQIDDNENNKFKIIAYERAADAVEHLSSEAKDLYDEGKLDEIPGVGKSISQHLKDIFEKGESTHFNRLLKHIPSAVFELLPLEGIGPKLAYKLAINLGIKSPNAIEKLKTKALEGKIEILEGFGKDSQNGIIKAINDYKGQSHRYLLNYAENVSEMIISWMKKEKSIIRVDTLGSLRRKDSTIGDIDIACSTKNNKDAIEHFINYPNSKRTLEKGKAKASIIIPGNIQVDMRSQNPESYGSLLQHFTGSKHHNIKLREYALSLRPSLSLSEYGIRKFKIQKSNIKNEIQKSKLLKFKTEQEFYNYLGMKWIPPELREDNGEIEASITNSLPTLLELSDIKGDLQVHSNYDVETSHDLGLSDFNEITNKAKSLGYEYVALTDHNPSHTSHTQKNIYDILKKRKEIIEEFNYSHMKSKSDRVIRLFNSLEIDILSDSTLPTSEKSLELLDFALVSIHSGFRNDKKSLTKRVLSALNHPKIKVFAHPTARKLNEREGVELDWEKIFDFCLNNNKYIEINGDPMRLDLPDHLVKDAVKYGVKISMGTDAHHIDHMDNMKYAVYVARRGWSEKKNIINTLSLDQFIKMLNLEIIK